MHAVHAGDVPRALALVDAGHAALHEQRRSLQATGEALEAVAGREAGPVDLPPSGMRIGEVAAYLGVRPSALRVWEAAGLLTPQRERGTGYRRFDPADIRDAQMIHMLRQGHYLFPQIRVILDGLHQTGSSDALRAAIAQRRAQLTLRAAAMLEAATHLHSYVGDALITEPPRG
jgi:DNA-binding transcriptional MerR regulator